MRGAAPDRYDGRDGALFLVVAGVPAQVIPDNDIP